MINKLKENTKIKLINTDTFLLKLNSSITQATMFSIRAITVVNAAKNIKIKKNVPTY